MFTPDTIIRRTKGKMIMLYAVVDGEEAHVASFFHKEKADFVLAAIESATEVEIVDEDAPKKKKATAAKTGAKKKTKKK